MSIEELLVAGRIAERLLVIGLAGLSLWLGWKLFFISARQEDQVAEFSVKDIAIKLQKVAPGVMFALFGGVIMVVALTQNLKVTVPASKEDQTGVKYYEYLSTDKVEIARQLKSVNLAVRLSGLLKVMDLQPDDRTKFIGSAPTFQSIQLDLVKSLVTSAQFENWRALNQAYSQNPNSVRVPQREDVEIVNKLLSDE